MIMEENTSKKKRAESAAAASWELTFCALMLILVAFFAMLVSYSSIEDEKVFNFQRGFGGDAMRSIDESVDATGYMPTEGDRVRMPSKEMVSLETQTVMLAYERLERAARMTPQAVEAVTLERTDRGFKAVLKGDVLFASGTADIAPDFYPYLDELAAILEDPHIAARVEGHTDSVPIATERFPSNWELSTARAVSIIRYFLEREAAEPERLEAVGFGEYRPQDSNDTPEGRALNRRVECFFEPAAKSRT